MGGGSDSATGGDSQAVHEARMLSPRSPSSALPATVRALRLSALSVFHRKSLLCDIFGWPRVWRALNDSFRRFPAGAVVGTAAPRAVQLEPGARGGEVAGGRAAEGSTGPATGTCATSPRVLTESSYESPELSPRFQPTLRDLCAGEVRAAAQGGRRIAVAGQQRLTAADRIVRRLRLARDVRQLNTLCL